MRVPVFLVALVLACGVVAAASPSAQSTHPKGKAAASSAEQTKNALRTRLEEKFPGLKVQDIGPSPVPGLYEFVADGELMYITADGKYLIDAQIMDIDTRVNVTEAKRAADRKRVLAELDEKQMIVFGPPSAKYTVTVFTDVDCGYCQRLHSHIAELNELGVRVRYLAFPRGGPGSVSWHKMEEVWCSSDRNTAITRAKQGEVVTAGRKCTSTPVKSQYELGERLGVKGTPAIFTESGHYIGGYYPPKRLLEEIKKQQG
jgi:thiol:disulfide interchange protein DsbC